MTHISDDDVRHLAQLSSLQLSDDELKRLGATIGDVLTYVQELDELSTDGVAPTYQVTGLQNVWRNDEVQTSQVSRKELLALAPQSQNDQVKVPKVL